jgi:hypothetical protein
VCCFKSRKELGLALAAGYPAESRQKVAQLLTPADDMLAFQIERLRRAVQCHADNVPVGVSAHDLALQVEDRGGGRKTQTCE